MSDTMEKKKLECREQFEEISLGMIRDARKRRGKQGQDVLVKYSIPMSEQKKVLGKLDLINITAYSLFGSEPSLMDTLAIRELVLEM